MMIVTTSSFSHEAMVFAQQVGVQLIDGESLVELCRRAWGSSMPAPADANISCMLTRGDIMARIPEDMRYRY